LVSLAEADNTMLTGTTNLVPTDGETVRLTVGGPACTATAVNETSFEGRLSMPAVL
jgi:hypothetical protein